MFSIVFADGFRIHSMDSKEIWDVIKGSSQWSEYNDRCHDLHKQLSSHSKEELVEALVYLGDYVLIEATSKDGGDTLDYAIADDKTLCPIDLECNTRSIFSRFIEIPKKES